MNEVVLSSAHGKVGERTKKAKHGKMDGEETYGMNIIHPLEDLLHKQLSHRVIELEIRISK
jgi:hypothetical protein